MLDGMRLEAVRNRGPASDVELAINGLEGPRADATDETEFPERRRLDWLQERLAGWDVGSTRELDSRDWEVFRTWASTSSESGRAGSSGTDDSLQRDSEVAERVRLCCRVGLRQWTGRDEIEWAEKVIGPAWISEVPGSEGRLFRLEPRGCKEVELIRLRVPTVVAGRELTGDDNASDEDGPFEERGAATAEATISCSPPPMRTFLCSIASSTARGAGNVLVAEVVVIFVSQLVVPAVVEEAKQLL